MQKAVIAPLDDLQADTTNAFDDAPWVSPKARADAQDAIAEVRQAALDKVSADEFETAVNNAAERDPVGVRARGQRSVSGATPRPNPTR